MNGSWASLHIISVSAQVFDIYINFAADEMAMENRNRTLDEQNRLNTTEILSAFSITVIVIKTGGLDTATELVS